MKPSEDLFTTRRPELLAALAHELRSPIGAILGFEELLSEGIYGNVDERAREALLRVRSSARQLLQLVEGMSDLGHADDAAPEPVSVPLASLITECIDALRADAGARNSTLELHTADGLGKLRTDPERAARALQLTFGAAIKTTYGGRIHTAARRENGALALDIQGTGLAAERDDPDQGQKLSGAGLRIAMARRALRPLHGTLTLLPAPDTGTLQLRLPPLPD